MVGGPVLLTVWNMLGQRVATLVDEKLAGRKVRGDLERERCGKRYLLLSADDERIRPNKEDGPPSLAIASYGRTQCS